MIVRFEGRDWQFKSDLTLQQGIAIQLAYGFTVEAWEQGVEHGDARALQCLYWLMHAQNGITKTIKELDCSVSDLMSAVAEAMATEAAEEKAAREAEAAAAPEPVPTRPAGPPSPEPPSPPDTTPTPPEQPEVPVPATVS